jgi:ParB/RepB/Spo0J family partition protein
MTTATERQIVKVPIGLLRPDPKNPRRNADGSNLVASIKEFGVLQALHVRPLNDEGFHDIIFGARRYDGALKAECEEVPIIIREATPEDVALIQIIENFHERLDPIEEATGYFQLIELKKTQKALAAKLGVTPKQVSARLKLLQLPAAAQAQVKTGELTVETAAELVAYAAYPDLVEQAIGERNPTHAIERLIRERDAVQAAEGRRAELTAAGVTVADAAEDGWLRVTEDVGYSTGSGTIGFDRKACKKHTGEPCHVVVVRPNHFYSGGLISEVAYCSDARRHKTGGDAAIKTAATERASGPGRAEKMAENKSRRDASASRLEFLTAKLAKGRLPRGADTLILDVAVEGLLRVSNGWDGAILQTACALAGLDLDTERGKVPPTWANDHTAVRERILAHFDTDAARRRLLFAALVAEGHLDLANDQWTADVERLQHILDELDYEPTEWETDRQARAVKHAA